MKTKFTVFTALLLLASPFISIYCHISLTDAIIATLGMPLIIIMSYNIWRIADAIDRLSDK